MQPIQGPGDSNTVYIDFIEGKCRKIPSIPMYISYIIVAIGSVYAKQETTPPDWPIW